MQFTVKREELSWKDYISEIFVILSPIRGNLMFIFDIIILFSMNNFNYLLFRFRCFQEVKQNNREVMKSVLPIKTTKQTLRNVWS